MSKITKIIHKEKRKDNLIYSLYNQYLKIKLSLRLNGLLVIIEQDSELTKKRVIAYPFNKEKSIYRSCPKIK